MKALKGYPVPPGGWRRYRRVKAGEKRRARDLWSRIGTCVKVWLPERGSGWWDGTGHPMPDASACLINIRRVRR